MSFLRDRRTGGSSRRRADADRRSCDKRIGWVDDYFIGFSHTAQNFGLHAKVSSDLHVTNLHNAIGTNDANLQALSAEDESVIRQRQHLS